MGKQKNRWLIALSAISIHLSIGSVYAFSVFKNPLTDQLGWNSGEVALPFTIAIFCLGVSAALLGNFVEQRGPRISAVIAAIFFSIGLIGSGLAIEINSSIMFYVCYGVIGGIGLGIGYIAPVSTLVKWFPDRRGMATGMAVLGFGAGSLICSPIAARLIESVGVSTTLYSLGIAYFILMISGALYITRPEEGWVPKAMQGVSTTTAKTAKIIQVKKDLAQLNANEAVKTARFWMLWVMMLINIASGIMIISVASQMAQEKVGMTITTAAMMVGVMGLFNGAGRIGWATVSDYIGRTNVFILFFAFQFIIFLLLPQVMNPVIFQIFIFVMMTCYGGGFATLPAYIGDLFGTKQLGTIMGYLLTSWSIAGIVGPMIVAYFYDQTGHYDGTFYVFSVLLAIALVTTYFMRMNIKQVGKRTLQG